ncbi:hypothetical protein V7166_22245 [Bacillus thuringiensis]
MLVILLVKENREMEKVKYINQQQEKQAFVDSLFVFFYPYRTVIFM